MTLAECKALKKGDKLYVNLGNGWRQQVTFIKLIKVTTFPSMTLSDLMKRDFDLSKGKEEWKAECETIDDKGKTRTGYWRPRALHVYKPWELWEV